MGTKKNNLGVRIAMAVIGIALTAVSVGLQKISGLGVDPFSVIIFGFSNAFHATYQTVYIVVCAVLLIIAFVFNRLLKFYSNFWFVFLLIVLYGTFVMNQPIRTDGVLLHRVLQYVKEFLAIRGQKS